jgi:hypothetical protein
MARAVYSTSSWYLSPALSEWFYVFTGDPDHVDTYVLRHISAAALEGDFTAQIKFRLGITQDGGETWFPVFAEDTGALGADLGYSWDGRIVVPPGLLLGIYFLELSNGSAILSGYDLTPN